MALHQQRPSKEEAGEPPRSYWTLRRLVLELIPGAGAGAAASFVTGPLDVAKTRLQVVQDSQAGRYQGTLSTLRTIAREEGLRGLYRGWGTAMLALVPNWTVYFSSYDYAKTVLRREARLGDGPVMHVVAAVAAAAVTNVVTNPLWLVKTRLQTQHLLQPDPRVPHYTGTLNAFASVVRREGFFALWKGVSAQFLGISHVAIQFPLYEDLKRRLPQLRGAPAGELAPLDVVVASAVSKVVASTLCYPHEVLRSKMHIERMLFLGVTETALDVYHRHGLQGFYRGLGTNIMRVVPTAAITFTAYEMLSSVLGLQHAAG